MPSRPTRVPLLTTDEEAEAFLAQDLSALDPAQFRPLPQETSPRPSACAPGVRR